MVESACLKVFREEELSTDKNFVFLDWWAVGHSGQLPTNWSVVNHHTSEQEAISLALLEGQMFSLLADVLNNLHSARHSRRYWRIVLGAWHQEFFFTLVDRRARLLEANHMSKSLTLDGYSNIQSPLVLEDGTTFPRLTGEPMWESLFVSQLVTFMKQRSQLENIAIVEKEDYVLLPTAPSSVAAKSSLEKLVRKLEPLALFLDRFSKFELHDTYLTPKEEFALRFRLRNFSFMRLGETAPLSLTTDIDVDVRRGIQEQLVSLAPDTEFCAVLSEMIARHIPRNYVEGFHHLSQKVRGEVRRSPKLLFTSNRFGMSDSERMKIAEKVQRGTKYVVAQHGNNYGVTYCPLELPEEETSDVFLRWGGAFIEKSPVLGVSTRGLRIPKELPSQTGSSPKVLIVGSQPPSRTFRYYDWDQYFASEKDTVVLVESFMKQGVDASYRPYAGNIFGGGVTKEFEVWLSQSSIPRSTGSFKSALSATDMTVFLYDSTGFLELASENRPCLQIQLGPKNHVASRFHGLYDDMIRVGLLHESAESALKILGSVKAINTWWDSLEVQEVLSSVRSALAVPNHNIVNDLAAYLRQIAQQKEIETR